MKNKINAAKYIVLTLYSSIIVAVIYAAYTNQWYLFLISLVLWYINQSLGHAIALHRLFTHRSFKTQRWKEVLLACWSVLCGLGSPVSYATTHRSHHQNADTFRDPHSPKNLGFWTCLFNLQCFEDRESFQERTQGRKYFSQQLKQDPVVWFIHKNYLKIWAALMVTVFILGGFAAVLFGLLVPAALCTICGSMVSALGHSHGYRTFDTPDLSTNSWIANLVTFGEGYQNNHHYNASSPNLALSPGEVDLHWPIIKHFFMINESNVKNHSKHNSI